VLRDGRRDSPQLQVWLRFDMKPSPGGDDMIPRTSVRELLTDARTLS